MGSFVCWSSDNSYNSIESCRWYVTMHNICTTCPPPLCRHLAHTVLSSWVMTSPNESHDCLMPNSAKAIKPRTQGSQILVIDTYTQGWASRMCTWALGTGIVGWMVRSHCMCKCLCSVSLESGEKIDRNVQTCEARSGWKRVDLRTRPLATCCLELCSLDVAYKFIASKVVVSLPLILTHLCSCVSLARFWEACCLSVWSLSFSSEFIAACRWCALQAPSYRTESTSSLEIQSPTGHLYFASSFSLSLLVAITRAMQHSVW